MTISMMPPYAEGTAGVSGAAGLAHVGVEEPKPGGNTSGHGTARPWRPCTGQKRFPAAAKRGHEAALAAPYMRASACSGGQEIGVYSLVRLLQAH